MPRLTRARISTAALQHNLQRVRALAAQAQVVACVKANGYGHGLQESAAALAPHSDALGVATLEEALTLREAGIDRPILLLEGVHEAADWEVAIARGLTVAVTDPAHVDWLASLSSPSPPSCWLKVDTGMRRLGVAPDAVGGLLSRLAALGVIAPVTLMTHFSQADEPSAVATDAQLTRFSAVVPGSGLPRSCANSAAILSRPDAHMDWVRPGYMLYGGSPFADRSSTDCGLRAAMCFESRVIALRDVPAGEAVGYGGRWVAQRPSRIATIAAGYGDGYPRLAPDGTPLLIDGVRVPLSGRVSMDMLTADVTDVPTVGIGSAVELWGDEVPVDEVARAVGTIGYELLAGMPQRVPREYR